MFVLIDTFWLEMKQNYVIKLMTEEFRAPLSIKRMGLELVAA